MTDMMGQLCINSGYIRAKASGYLASESAVAHSWTEWWRCITTHSDEWI